MQIYSPYHSVEIKIKMNTAILAPENIIYFSFFYFRKESFLLPKTKQSTRKISFSTG